jgi:hypothetical protein
MSEQLLESSNFENYKVPPIRYRLSEFIIEETGLIYELNDIKPGDKLPTESEWLRSENSTESIIEFVSFELKEHIDTVAKRIYDMHNEKYLDLKKPSEHRQKPITNIRLTGKGIKYYVKTTEQLRQEEGLIDEVAVAELESMVARCAEIANKIGNIALAEDFRKRYDLKSPFELSQEEFEIEMNTVSAQLAGLGTISLK